MADLIKFEDVIRMYRIPRETVREWIKNETIPFVRQPLGRLVKEEKALKFDRFAIERWIREVKGMTVEEWVKSQQKQT